MLKVVPTPEVAKELETAQETIANLLLKETNSTLKRIADIIEPLKLSGREKTRYAEFSSCAIAANVFSHLIAAARLSGVSREESALYVAMLASKSCERAMTLAEITVKSERA